MNGNEEIKRYMKFRGVPQWSVAKMLGIHENTLSRRLRGELSAEQREAIYNAVDKIVRDRSESEVTII